MKSFRLAITLFILAFVPTAFAAAKGNAAQGKTAFGQHCAACHGKDGGGNPALANMLKTTIPPLSSKEVQALSDAQMAKVISDGKGKMPAQKSLSAAEVANLVAFIRTLKK